MTTPEGPDVNANTRNNNKIAWKNVTVVNFPCGHKISSALLRNVFAKPVLAGLHLRIGKVAGVSFFDFGRIFVNLPPELGKRWRERGAKGEGFKLVYDTQAGRIEIRSPDALIQDLPLEQGEACSSEVRSFCLKH